MERLLLQGHEASESVHVLGVTGSGIGLCGPSFLFDAGELGSAVLSIAFGVLMLIFPGAGALAIVSMIGIYSLVSGVLLTALGFRIRHPSTFGRHAMPTNGTATPA